MRIIDWSSDGGSSDLPLVDPFGLLANGAMVAGAGSLAGHAESRMLVTVSIRHTGIRPRSKALALHVLLAHCARSALAEVRRELLHADGVLVWVNPIEGGRDSLRAECPSGGSRYRGRLRQCSSGSNPQEDRKSTRLNSSH